MAEGPRCFIWRFEMLSDPVAGEFFNVVIREAVS